MEILSYLANEDILPIMSLSVAENCHRMLQLLETLARETLWAIADTDLIK